MINLDDNAIEEIVMAEIKKQVSQWIHGRKSIVHQEIRDCVKEQVSTLVEQFKDDMFRDVAREVKYDKGQWKSEVAERVSESISESIVQALANSKY